MYNSQDVASRIKSLAKFKKISTGKMLSDCDLSKNALSTMQSGGFLPRTESLAKIADYLDCSVDYLLGRDKFVTSHKAADYDKLDIEDKAEIRGIIKQMLKADKYKKTDSYAQSVHDFDNALDITPLFEQYKVDKN